MNSELEILKAQVQALKELLAIKDQTIQEFKNRLTLQNPSYPYAPPPVIGPGLTTPTPMPVYPVFPYTITHDEISSGTITVKDGIGQIATNNANLSAYYSSDQIASIVAAIQAGL